jgi:ATP-dependent 26S proteasome regulatory subunit
MNERWPEANSRYLEARVAVLRERLAAHMAPDDLPRTPFSVAEHLLFSAQQSLPTPSALEVLAAGFSLSRFETEVLVLCAGIEIDAQMAQLCAAINGSAERPFATVAVALAALPDPNWGALTPAAALRYWHLVDVRRGDSLTASELRLDERVLHFLLGVSYPEPRLKGVIVPAPPSSALAASEEQLVQRIVAMASRDDGNRTTVYDLCGDDVVAQTAIAAAAAEALQLRLHVITAADVPQQAADRDLLARLWEREAVLGNGALLIDDTEHGDHAQAVTAFAEDVRGLVFVATREPLAVRRRAAARIDVTRPTVMEQRTLWHEALGDVATRLNGSVDQLASHFRLGISAIRSVSRQVLDSEPDADPRQLANALWEACRVHARTRLESLARRIEPAATWDDLVLPDPQIHTLRNIVAHVRHRPTVYESWGFSRAGERDLGITALFAGASGTGKTMSAEIIANELRLDLYRIDLSQMVSKYIGETEKNLRRVFDAGEEGGAILLFDEADALFGRRSEVRDSHDRYANMEVSYLLQRMESYRGLAILTTNLKNVLDSAFLRRIRFIVTFPFPDSDQRARIWQRVFPRGTPTEDLDYAKLARLNVAGGNIRNIALHAAFLAAEEHAAVRMRHLLRAAHVEYAKLEKPLTDNLGGGWT